MLGIGWTEMLVIGVVALIFIGPKDLPVVMSKVGKVVGQIQRMGREFQREINKTTGLDEVRNLRSTITDPLKKTADEIRKEFNAIGKDGQQTPSGVLKPTDPKVESVADAIKEKAGMATAKTSTELAGEYGFKPKAAPEQPAATVTTPKSAAKPTRPRAASKPVAADVASTAEARPVRKPRSESAAAVPAEAQPVAKKPRVPRKKPAETAEKS